MHGIMILCLFCDIVVCAHIFEFPPSSDILANCPGILWINCPGISPHHTVQRMGQNSRAFITAIA